MLTIIFSAIRQKNYHMGFHWLWVRRREPPATRTLWARFKKKWGKKSIFFFAFFFAPQNKRNNLSCVGLYMYICFFNVSERTQGGRKIALRIEVTECCRTHTCTPIIFCFSFGRDSPNRFICRGSYSVGKGALECFPSRWRCRWAFSLVIYSAWWSDLKNHYVKCTNKGTFAFCSRMRHIIWDLASRCLFSQHPPRCLPNSF